MAPVLTLASQSTTRARLLRAAALEIDIVPARVDEETIRASLEAEQVSVRDMADALCL